MVSIEEWVLSMAAYLSWLYLTFVLAWAYTLSSISSSSFAVNSLPFFYALLISVLATCSTILEGKRGFLSKTFFTVTKEALYVTFGSFSQDSCCLTRWLANAACCFFLISILTMLLVVLAVPGLAVF